MTHNLHILLGNCAEQNISRIKEYVIKYGAEYVDKAGRSADDYLQLMLFDDSCQFLVAEQKKVDDKVFTAGIDDSFAVELVPVGEPMAGEESAKKLIHFFSTKFTSTVNMNNRGDGNLHVCIHVPLYSEVAWTNAEALMSAIEATGSNYTVDLMLMSADLAFLTIDDANILAEKADELMETAKSTLQKIVEVKTSMRYRVLNSLILVQNHNEQGIALDLNRESYANLMGEYALSVTIDYNSIYSTAYLLGTKKEFVVLGLGLSMLNFDRYYFVQYLLRKAYNYILDREQVTQEEVNIDKVSNIAQQALVNNIGIFTNLYEEHVKSMIYDRKMSHEDIMEEIAPQIDAAMKRVAAECTKFIESDDISLPEKRATLAQILGEDDPLLVGVQYNAEQLIIDECRNDVMSLFVSANNSLAIMPEDALDEQENPIRENAILSTEPGVPVEPVESRIRRIKQLKYEIKTSTDYIRREEALLEELMGEIKVEHESHKRLTPDGFQFGGQVYRLNPKNIERPLEETYTPVAGKLPSEADLRQDFTVIKDQGSLGSCTAFAVVAAYEYLLKRDKKQDIDLSELFAYQNARSRMSEERKAEGEGTSIYDMIKGMGEDGICLENLHPYVTENLPEPSPEAREEAQGRKITKALNVNCDLHDFKSALSQGYPIIISLRLFESFDQPTGFIPRPTDDERAREDHANHAMVVCGYSDNDRVFIVRNSWGTRFGDKGYCYIPYSYITDPELMNQACVITEISEAEIKVAGFVKKVAVSFNKEDAEIQAARKRILIGEEYIRVEALKAMLNVCRDDYYMLEAKLGQPSTRETLRVGTEKRLKWEITQLQERKRTLETERVERLDDFDADSRNILIFAGIALVAVITIYAVLTFMIEGFQLSYWVTGITGLGALTLAVSPILYRRTRQFVPDSISEKHDSNVLTIWLGSIAIGAVALIVSIFFLDYFNFMVPQNFEDSPVAEKVIETVRSNYTGRGLDDLMLSLEEIMDENAVSWYDYNILTTLVLSLLLFLPFGCIFLCRRGIRNALDDKYREEIQKIARNIASREDAKTTTKLRMHIAGRILDSITALISRLRKKYYGMRSYVDNLAAWRFENDEQLDMEPVNRQPFMSLINNKCLDNYFEKYGEELTADVRLYKLLNKDSDLSEEQVIAFKNAIKKSVAERLWDSVADFSIYDHVVGKRKYEYVDEEYVDVQELISTMDLNSEIFVRTTMRMSDPASVAMRSKMLFRAAPGNDGSRSWDASVETMFSTKPTMHDLASENKIFIIRLEGLKPEEITILR